MITKIKASMFYVKYLARADLLEVITKMSELKFIGPTYTSFNRPSPFVCCLYRLIDLGPSEDTIAPLAEQNYFLEMKLIALMYLRGAFPATFKSFYDEASRNYSPLYYIDGTKEEKLAFDICLKMIFDGSFCTFSFPLLK